MRRKVIEKNCVRLAVANVGGATNMARLLGVSRSRIYRWIAAGKMPTVDVETVVKIARLSHVGIMELTGIKDIGDHLTHTETLKQWARKSKLRLKEPSKP